VTSNLSRRRLTAGGFFLAHTFWNRWTRLSTRILPDFPHYGILMSASRNMKLRCSVRGNNELEADRREGWRRPLALNPVTGLWSGCTRLHSKQIHFCVFR
jgi:hypothetical protein